MSETWSSIGFEGINRVGKGTQIEKISNALACAGCVSVTLRGDGSRDGLGKHLGDPKNDWWQHNAHTLRTTGTTYEWHVAADKLVNELLVERRAHPGVIPLLDRTIISRAAFVLDREDPPVGTYDINHLYPVRSGVDYSLEEIVPDVIILLEAPRDVVLGRLDPMDPKSDFRRRVISDSYETFYRAEHKLPRFVQDRILHIDSSRPIDQVFDAIMDKLNIRIP